MTNEIIAKTLGLMENLTITRTAEYQLQVFKTLIAILQIVSGDNSMGHQSLQDLRDYDRIQKMIIKVIHSASKPYFHSDTITEDYLQILCSFVGQNTEAFMSQIGIEFVLFFTLFHHANPNS